MICAYKNDIEKIGGFNKELKTWGEEDLKFAWHLAKNKDYKMIR